MGTESASRTHSERWFSCCMGLEWRLAVQGYCVDGLMTKQQWVRQDVTARRLPGKVNTRPVKKLRFLKGRKSLGVGLEHDGVDDAS